MANPARHTVVQRPNDPYLYLFVMGEWYCYNPTEPPLGSGAMGDVYRGYRCSNGAVVAIKRVKDMYANNKMIRERARLEASLAFRHPNLVEMIGYCEWAPDHGPIFILSNFVQGEDVDKYVKHFGDNTQRVEKICKVVCSILDALDYIHSKGVVHRDIKPSNIMIENDSNVRLMDLGISRMNGGNKFSQAGFIGTPQYAAPEQIKREEGNASATINATTDIYELGITFYELLTGKNPFDTEAEAETLAKQLKDPLPSDPAIPSKLMKVIWKATEKDQTKRYQTAIEFKSAINQSLLPDPPLSERIITWFKEHMVITVVSVMALIVFVFFVILLII